MHHSDAVLDKIVCFSIDFESELRFVFCRCFISVSFRFERALAGPNFKLEFLPSLKICQNQYLLMWMQNMRQIYS
jgi:hypothetical protein